jgi:hypothetical protein
MLAHVKHVHCGNNSYVLTSDLGIRLIQQNIYETFLAQCIYPNPTRRQVLGLFTKTQKSPISFVISGSASVGRQQLGSHWIFKNFY